MTRYTAEFHVPADASGVDGVKEEESGRALVLYAPAGTPVEDGGDGAFFVRLQSWDTTREHRVFRDLMGKRVRVVVETMND